MLPGLHSQRADQPGPPYLAGHVPPQAVAADSDHVRRLPAAGAVIQQPELRRQQLGVGIQHVHVGVDSGGEGFGDALRVAK